MIDCVPKSNLLGDIKYFLIVLIILFSRRVILNFDAIKITEKSFSYGIISLNNYILSLGSFDGQ